jgi:hypothetical protein
MSDSEVEQVAVVHDLYCTPARMKLKLSGDIYSASSRDCDVASFPWKRGGFKFKVTGVSNKKTLKDTAGEVIGTLTQTHVPSVAHAVEIAGPRSKFIVRTSAKALLFVRLVLVCTEQVLRHVESSASYHLITIINKSSW